MAPVEPLGLSLAPTALDGPDLVIDSLELGSDCLHGVGNGNLLPLNGHVFTMNEMDLLLEDPLGSIHQQALQSADTCVDGVLSDAERGHSVTDFFYALVDGATAPVDSFQVCPRGGCCDPSCDTTSHQRDERGQKKAHDHAEHDLEDEENAPPHCELCRDNEGVVFPFKRNIN